VDSPTYRLPGHGPGFRVPYARNWYVLAAAPRVERRLVAYLFSIASGLYYLSELVEEHTVLAKRLLIRLIYTIIGLQLLLCLFDGFPVKLSLLSIFSHVIYLGNMRRFPIVKLSDPLFISSCGELNWR
jgi:hypothetical protein